MTFHHFSRYVLALGLLVQVFTAHAQSDATTYTGASLLGGSAGLLGTSTPSLNPAMPGVATLGVAKPSVNETLTDKPPRIEARAKASREIPNQFQRFVQDATGKLLPVYGRELFEQPQAYGPDAAMAAPGEYILGPGDEVRLQVWGAVDYSGNHTIDRNGQITLPKVGVVMLAGVAVRDLESALRGHLAKVFNNFSLSANLGRLRTIQIYVVGQAQQPGTYTLSSLSTLINGLFASGGPSANGSMRNIRLIRKDKVVAQLDLYNFIAQGDKSRDVAMMAGDVIHIAPVGPRVAITGAFDQAAIYELKPDATSVADILNLTGGVPTLATPQKAHLERIASDQKLPRQVQDIMLDSAGLKLPLRDGDVLTLLPISQGFANAVTLQGAVADPMRYRWFPGMKILDLIPEREALITPDYYKRRNLLVQNAQVLNDGDNSKDAGNRVAERFRGAVDQVNWEYAVIERLDTARLSTTLIPFNLGKAVLQRDPAQNLALEPGDVVTILNQSDLRIPQNRQSRLVRVEGEVISPGIYQAIPGETLPQLVRRVGGLTPQAYLFGTDFSRESVRQRQQENLNKLIRRLEDQSQSQSLTAVSNAKTDNPQQALAVQQAQQAQLRSQVERLKLTRSSGRVALELDPLAKALEALPPIALEDGDRILIPAAPSFVSAVGAVNNENAMIYRSGKTAGEVLQAAGLTEESEPDQAFVLRADGSVISKRDRGGFFGGNFESLQLMPGDTVVVPTQLDRESRYNFAIRAAKDVTSILANFGLGAAAIKTLRN